MESLGIYISVPFCRSKCSFCNFASGVFPTTHFVPYIDRVVDDVRRVRCRMGAIGADLPAVVDSVYLGGGTPSILPPRLLVHLFKTLSEEFRLARDVEITMECAPGQLEDEMLEAMVEVGVNRVSFGVQSFVDREAAATGRLHDRRTALRDIERVREAGIDAISVDLIAGLPLQTGASWRESLTVLAGSGVSHASIYMFEVDEDSRLGSEVLSGGLRYKASFVPDDDAMAEFYGEAVAFLEAEGLQQYEISNFARPGAESRHNKKYWRREPYLGFGLDAHSMLKSGEGDVRFAETDDLAAYLRGDCPLDIHRLTQAEMLEEAWFLGLRLNEGVDLDDTESEFGLGSVDEEGVEALICEGLLERADGLAKCVRLTHKGRMLSNEVFGRFLDSSIAAECPQMQPA